jgi:hypothetical protein
MQTGKKKVNTEDVGKNGFFVIIENEKKTVF